MSILGWVLAWCGSGLNSVTVDFGAEINKELSFRYAIIYSRLLLFDLFLPFVCVDAVLDVIIQSWQFRRGGISFTEVISSCHHIQYLCWFSWSVCRPVGMWCDAALSRTVRNKSVGRECSGRSPLLVCICPSPPSSG